MLFPRRLVVGLICWLIILFVGNNAHAALGDVVAQYTFPASSFVLSPKKPYMYATIPSKNSIAIINTSTLAVEKTVLVGSGPVNLTFSPDGSTAYIANSTSNFVAVFDTQSRTVINSFLVPEQPQDVVFGSQNRLFVLGQSHIFQIDATVGTSRGASIGGSVFIYGGSLEISPDRNTLYYADYGLSPATMYKFNISGATPVLVLQTPFGTVGSNGEDLTLSHNGSYICYATGSGQSSYQIAKFRTSDFTTIGSFNTGPYPAAVAFSPDDSVVYASVDSASGIKVFNAITFVSLGTISGPNVASKLAVDSTGRFLFAGYTAYYSDFLGTRVYDTGRNRTGKPGITSNSVTNVASYAATLNGTVNSYALATTVRFEYGTTSSYGLTTANQSLGGSGFQNVVANISGLSANTTYHFRIVATNSAGTTYGSDRTFTTLSPTGAPVVTTNPASLIASFSATLNGSLDPHGLATNVYFQYGTTTSYGLTTAIQSKSGNTYQNVSANISGLSENTTYHFRIVATNSAGPRYGNDMIFTSLSATGWPVVTTNAATNLASSSATLNGTVDPHGLTTTVYFQYGTTTSYGHTTASQSKTGNTYQNVAANISGLTASTIYHFRIVATNSAGTKYGSDRTFTTL